MKSKEEIYKIAHTYAEWDLVPNKESTLTAMDIYAEQEAIECLNFAMNNERLITDGVGAGKIYELYLKYKSQL